MSKFVGTGPSSYEKRIYQATVSQRLRNTALHHTSTVLHISTYFTCISSHFQQHKRKYKCKICNTVFFCQCKSLDMHPVPVYSALCCWHPAHSCAHSNRVTHIVYYNWLHQIHCSPSSPSKSTIAVQQHGALHLYLICSQNGTYHLGKPQLHHQLIAEAVGTCCKQWMNATVKQWASAVTHPVPSWTSCTPKNLMSIMITHLNRDRSETAAETFYDYPAMNMCGFLCVRYI